jgi:hypothetical protein
VDLISDSDEEEYGESRAKRKVVLTTQRVWVPVENNFCHQIDSEIDWGM